MGVLASDYSCRQFNPSGEFTVLADLVEAAYWREWPKAVSPKMTSEERKNLQALIAKAAKDDGSFFFREPVDPVALNIPQYFDM